MKAIISNLVSRFEKGLLSRRRIRSRSCGAGSRRDGGERAGSLNFSAATIDHVRFRWPT